MSYGERGFEEGAITRVGAYLQPQKVKGAPYLEK
jgi:hypothetical protein